MKVKPDESVLMAYLYGELDAEEMKRVEEYLYANPEAQKEIQDLAQVRKGFSALTDREVIPPPILWEPAYHRFWQTPYFKVLTGIAASLIIVFVTGWLTGLSMRVADGELRIGFGAKASPPATLTAEAVQRMISESLAKNNQALASGWATTEQRLTESIRLSLASNALTNRDALVKQVASATQDQVREYVAALQEENARMMKNYLTLSASEQQQVIEELLVDFSRYLNQQRTNDLLELQQRLTRIEQNTDLFKQETEQLLTSIIASVDETDTKEIRN
jgi:hypothetical protein